MTRYQKNFLNTYPFSDANLNALLAEDTAVGWTVPGSSTQKYRVKFRCSYTAEVWVSYNGTATSPGAGDTATVAYQELLPLNECRYVKGGDTLSFLCTNGTPAVSAQLLLVEDTTNL